MSDSNPKILIVDDLPMVRSSLKHILKGLGYERVDEASDGYDALGLMKAQAHKKDPFDLVFCDFVMPHMDGMSFLRRMKCERHVGDTPLIMVTAERDRASGLIAIREGAADYVMKPLTPKSVEEKMFILFEPSMYKVA